MTEKILIPWSELRGNKWKLHEDGLLELDGKTEFPTTDPDGKVTGSHSYYLDKDSAPVKVQYKDNMLKRMGD